jgi:hypothetical protein
MKPYIPPGSCQVPQKYRSRTLEAKVAPSEVSTTQMVKGFA